MSPFDAPSHFPTVFYHHHHPPPDRYRHVDSLCYVSCITGFVIHWFLNISAKIRSELLGINKGKSR